MREAYQGRSRERKKEVVIVKKRYVFVQRTEVK
jgi:hypothetical protein